MSGSLRRYAIVVPIAWGLSVLASFVGGIVLMAYFSKPTDSKSSAAAQDVTTLYASLLGYYSHYGRCPILDGQGRDVVTDTLSNRALCRALLGQDSRLNPDGHNFFGYRDGAAVTNPILVDPWNQPYRVVMDADGDGNCDVPDHGTITGQHFVVWSDGGEPIASWRLRLKNAVQVEVQSDR